MDEELIHKVIFHPEDLSEDEFTRFHQATQDPDAARLLFDTLNQLNHENHKDAHYLLLSVLYTVMLENLRLQMEHDDALALRIGTHMLNLMGMLPPGPNDPGGGYYHKSNAA